MAVEPIGWQVIGDRSFAPVTLAAVVVVGLALPTVLLPRDRRGTFTLIALATMLPFLFVMVTLGAAG